MAKQTTKGAKGRRGTGRAKRANTGATPAEKARAAPTPGGSAKARKRGAKRGDTGRTAPDLDALRAAATGAKAGLDEAERKAAELDATARKLRAEAKAALRAAVAPYRDACRTAGLTCEYAAGRALNVSERVSFDVEKVAKGLKVTVKGRPGTEEVIPLAKLKVSIGKAAYDYTDTHLGPRGVVGNKGGSLSNRLRAALKGGAK